MTIRNADTQFCVVSSAGENLGCFLDREAAEARLQETGQERLLQVIGETARLEQREVLGVLNATDPAYASTPLTCGTPAEQATEECSFEALKDQNVVFTARDDATKYQLGPVEITGDAIDKASAVYNAGSSTSVGQGWEIRFDLTNEGSGTFSDVTTRLQGRQLAIVVDDQVISAPTVQSPITNGSGVITGSFTESARQGPGDAAERRSPARGAHHAAGPDREPDPGRRVAAARARRGDRGARAARRPTSCSTTGSSRSWRGSG